MKTNGELYLTEDKILRFDLEKPQTIEGLNEPIFFVLYEVLQIAIQQFGEENIIAAISGGRVQSEIELPNKIDSQLLNENEELLVGYV